MKKLSELVRLKERITAVYSTQPVTDQLDLLSHSLSTIAEETVLEPSRSDLNDIIQDLSNVYHRIDRNNEIFDLLIADLDRQINRESQKFLSDNYSLELRVEHEAVDNIRKIRVMDLNDSVTKEITDTIRLHTNWKYPALDLGCRDGEWTRHMVAADPLYIADHYRDFISSTLSQYEEAYQRRIRPYLIKDTDLSALPAGQFGFVFCWNYLNYRSLDTVKEYLKAVKELLRPGGVFMFSYNNGDMHECAGYAEGFWMSYIPKTLLVPMCESLGYEILHAKDSRESGTVVSWLELRKPGELRTVKAHQVLGEFCRREL